MSSARMLRLPPVPVAITPEASVSSASRACKVRSMAPWAAYRPPLLRPPLMMRRSLASLNTMDLSAAAPAVPRLTTVNSAKSVFSVPRMPAADTL